LRNARQANSAAQHLSRGLAGLSGVEVLGATEANILFCRLPSPAIQSLLQAGLGFYHDRWEQNVVRFVTSFSTTIEDVDNLLAHVARAVGGHQSDN
jgi:threonine aldolase